MLYLTCNCAWLVFSSTLSLNLSFLFPQGPISPQVSGFPEIVSTEQRPIGSSSFVLLHFRRETHHCLSFPLEPSLSTLAFTTLFTLLFSGS